MSNALGFDVGATKVGWGVVSEEGELLSSGRFPTPHDPELFIESLRKVIAKNEVVAIGIGIPGTISEDHHSTVLCTNVPALSELAIAERLGEAFPGIITVDNDARCALIGEVWKGAAQNMQSVALLTLGTGIGGAIMQKGIVRPHPTDIADEISRIVVDPTDVFPARSGAGTVEAFLGGRNLEERFQIDLAESAKKVRKGDDEAKEIWHAISYYFIQCMRSIQSHYSCRNILIGGIGSEDVEFYLQDTPPCPILPAKLGAQAAVYGAARIAFDLWAEENNPDWD